MKKVISMLTLVVFASCAVQSQPSQGPGSKFIEAMEASLKIMDTATMPSTWTMLANSFERIGNAEKKYWQPYYYASLCYALMALGTPDKTQIDPLAATAEGYLEKASSINSNSSEIAALTAMIINSKILADPISRFQEYSIQSAGYLQKAKEQDPANPRPYLIEARTKLLTPPAFGGGPEAAKPVIEKAIALYKEFKPENSIAPTWGMYSAEKLLAKVNGK